MRDSSSYSSLREPRVSTISLSRRTLFFVVSCCQYTSDHMWGVFVLGRQCWRHRRESYRTNSTCDGRRGTETTGRTAAPWVPRRSHCVVSAASDLPYPLRMGWPGSLFLATLGAQRRVCAWRRSVCSFYSRAWKIARASKVAVMRAQKFRASYGKFDRFNFEASSDFHYYTCMKRLRAHLRHLTRASHLKRVATSIILLASNVCARISDTWHARAILRGVNADYWATLSEAYWLYVRI
jgi:hypothetical protein